MLAGIRLLDKSREGNEVFRIEVWTKIAEENHPINQKIKEHIQEKYVEELIKTHGGSIFKNNDIGFSKHKTGGHGGGHKDSYKDKRQ